MTVTRPVRCEHGLSQYDPQPYPHCSWRCRHRSGGTPSDESYTTPWSSRDLTHVDCQIEWAQSMTCLPCTACSWLSRGVGQRAKVMLCSDRIMEPGYHTYLIHTCIGLGATYGDGRADLKRQRVCDRGSIPESRSLQKGVMIGFL